RDCARLEPPSPPTRRSPDLARRLYTALPDLHLVVEDRIFSADKVAARCTYTGTQRGPFLGIAPTGKQIKFGTIDIWRVEGGKLRSEEHTSELQSRENLVCRL